MCPEKRKRRRGGSRGERREIRADHIRPHGRAGGGVAVARRASQWRHPADARPHRGTCGARIRVICTCEALILMSDTPQVSQCQTTQRFYGIIRLIRWGTSRATPPARAGTSRGAPPPSGDVGRPCATHAHAPPSPTPSPSRSTRIYPTIPAAKLEPAPPHTLQKAPSGEARSANVLPPPKHDAARNEEKCTHSQRTRRSGARGRPGRRRGCRTTRGSSSRPAGTAGSCRRTLRRCCARARGMTSAFGHAARGRRAEGARVRR